MKLEPHEQSGQASPGLTPPQKWAAFVVGCLVLAVLLVAALRGWLPPGLSEHAIRVSIAVAGAGFALFLFGYFDWQIRDGFRVGGTVGIFVLLYLSSGHITPALVPTPQSFVDCERSLLNKQFDIAEEFCTHAVADTQEGHRSLSLLANAQYQVGKVLTAVGTWERAIAKGANRGVGLYNIAFAYYTDRQYEKSSMRAREAVKETASRPKLQSRIFYLIASAEYSLWNFVTGADASQHFDAAEANYKAFIENGTPKFRAYGILACMYAIAGAAAGDATQKANFLKLALVQFDKAIDDLKEFDRPSDKGAEVRAFVNSFSSRSDQDCGPAISSAWNRRRPNKNYEAQLAVLRD